MTIINLQRTKPDAVHEDALPVDHEAGIVDEAVDVSILIPTFRRTHLLTNLLRLCAQQTARETFNVEIVIVDNCSAASARQTVADVAETLDISIRYIHEPRGGISYARNAGLAAARGHLLAFIDDDEIPGTDWLKDLIETRDRFRADVVLGPVIPLLDTCPSDRRDFLGKVFAQNSEQPSGTEIRTKTVGAVLQKKRFCFRPLATSNALMVRDRCVLTAEAFSLDLGRTGGEDVLFFLDLQSAGRKIVWCREATVYENFPPERFRLSYVALRYFRSGQVTSFICMMTRRRRYLQLLEAMSFGVVQTIVGAVLALLCTPFRRDAAIRFGFTALAGLGKIFWTRQFRLYAYGASAPKRLFLWSPSP